MSKKKRPFDPVHHDGYGLNDRITVYPGPQDETMGSPSHTYMLVLDGDVVSEIKFQHGPRDQPGSQPGVTDDAILAVLIDRLRGFQDGPFACRENALRLTKLEEALHWGKSRADSRHRQGVLGSMEAHEPPISL